jgi:murein DD-endopeptidase MepM/ murein hydrolase activator NlpD
VLKKVLIGLLAAAIGFGPAVVLLGVAVLMNPAANAACLPGGALTVGPIPDSLTVTTRAGETFTLNKTQLTHAATIITVGGRTEGVGRDGVTIALMAALTESTLRQLANTGTYPESGSYPNDGNGSDHDSLGLFQMRPQSGWGTVAELMDTTYQAQAFYGGPSGPNFPSPRGLLDIPGWQSMDKGEAAQSVEVSAYPDRYQNYQPVAETILSTLTRPAPGTGAGGEAGGGDPVVPETSRVVFPLPSGTWVRTGGYGMRVHPITGELKLHTGTDYGAPAGTPILAAADGVVAFAGMIDGYGGLITIEHTVGGQRFATAYAHSWENGIHVQAGQRVTAGQHIGDVGSSGYSTGPHLHFEVRLGGANQPAIDAEPWLAGHGALDLDDPTGGGNSAGCTPSGSAAAPAPVDGADPAGMVPDPTGTGGQVTKRTAHMIGQARAAYPDTGWACWSPRPGTTSEHPLGRACDVTVGNRIGTRPTSPQLAYGWELTNWLQTNADTLGIEYLIWQGKIWSLSRDAEGWRPYDGGGMHDPADVTGGHYDHIHITVKAG